MLDKFIGALETGGGGETATALREELRQEVKSSGDELRVGFRRDLEEMELRLVNVISRAIGGGLNRRNDGEGDSP
jgi:hypothetical protein